jgi:hypothetical protein
MKRLIAIALLVVAGCGGTAATPTLEYKLAAISAGGDPDQAAIAEFGDILDTLQAGTSVCEPERDRQKIADTLVAGWELGGKSDSLLEWARALAALCR